MEFDKNKQYKKHFDPKSRNKMLKSAGLASTAMFTLYFLKYINVTGIGWGEPIIAMIVPTIINAIREWLKGEGIEVK